MSCLVKSHRKTLFSILFLSIFLLETLFSLSTVAYAQGSEADEEKKVVETNQTNSSKEEIQNALNLASQWLLNEKNENGSFSNDGLIQQTCEVVSTLNGIVPEETLDLSKQWVNEKIANLELNNDELAELLKLNGAEDTLLKQLFENQRKDGGFGLSAKYTSDPYDSMLVLEALANTKDLYQPQVLQLISYFLSTQKEDGGWGYNTKLPSNYEITARILTAIQQYKNINYINAQVLNESIARGEEYLNIETIAPLTEENFSNNILLYTYMISKSSFQTMNDTIKHVISAQKMDGEFGSTIVDTYRTIRLLRLAQDKVAIKTEVKSLLLESNLDYVYINNDTKIKVTYEINYETNYDKDYLLSVVVQDGENVLAKNDTPVQLTINQWELSGDAVAFSLNENEEKEILVTAILKDENGTTVLESTKTIQVKSKFIDTDILLIQTVLPWNSSANEEVLNSLSVSYDKLTAEQALKVDLLRYRVIIVANDQTSSVYGSIAALKTELESFVKNGGTMIYGVCDGGWSSGTSSPYIPGNIKIARDYKDNNYIVDENHPIVTAIYSENIPLTNSDLYNRYASHIYFVPSTLPENTNIIFKSSNNLPTLIEYNIGKGSVIASGLTWEHSYTTGFNSHNSKFGRKALDDLFLYALNRTYDNIDEELGTVLSTITLDKEEYQANDVMKIHVSSELSSFRRQAKAILKITDDQGNVYKKLLETEEQQLVVGIPSLLDTTWEVENLLAGTYKVTIEWYDDDVVIGYGEKTFKIQPDAGLQNKISLLKNELTSHETLVITDLITNLSKNHIANDLTVTYEITDADNKIVWSNKKDIDEILYQSDKEVKTDVALETFTSGEYTITSYVSEKGVKLCFDSSKFVVIEVIVDPVNITGEIDVMVNMDDQIINYNYTIKNQSNHDVKNLDVFVKTVQTVSGPGIDVKGQKVDVASRSAIEIADTNNIEDEEKWPEGSYLAILYIINDKSEEVVLDVKSFMIENRVPIYYRSGYSLFASENSVRLNGYKFNINGMVYSDKEFMYQGSILNINSSLTSTEGFHMAGWQETIQEKNEFAQKIELPLYTDKILANLRKAKATEIDVINGIKNYSDTPIICNQLMSEYCYEVKLGQSLVANQSFGLNVQQVEIGQDEQVVFSSLNGDIEINASNLFVNGLIYAPNGTVTLNVNQVNIRGSIIAKNIVINCTELTATPNE